jgi:hypothetical protein
MQEVCPVLQVLVMLYSDRPANMSRCQDTISNGRLQCLYTKCIVARPLKSLRVKCFVCTMPKKSG